MSWPYTHDNRSVIPPIGQGLAIVASVAAIGVVLLIALAGYLLSLHVAAAGKEGEALDARLQSTHQDIQRLKDELDVRSRLVEQERWSATLGLRAPDGRQYATSTRQLDAFAAARREIISADGARKIAESPCAATPFSPPCQLAAVGGQHGYTPVARKQMDSLIGDILR